MDLVGAGVEINRQHAPDDLAPFVDEFWQYKVQRQMDYVPVQVFPSGCVVLRFNLTPWGVDSFVYGPSTINNMKGAFFHEWTMFGVVLRPESASHFLGMPLHELRDLRVDLRCLWPRLARTLNERMQETESFVARVGLMSEALRSFLLNNRGPKADFLNALQDVVCHTAQGGSIDAIAKRHQLNHRTLRRYFHQYLGLGPKEMERLVRVQQTMRRLARIPLSGLAALSDEYGFSDQSHFTREFRAIVGQSPKSFTAMIGQAQDKSRPEWRGLKIDCRYSKETKQVHRFE